MFFSVAESIESVFMNNPVGLAVISGTPSHAIAGTIAMALPTPPIAKITLRMKDISASSG